MTIFFLGLKSQIKMLRGIEYILPMEIVK